MHTSVQCAGSYEHSHALVQKTYNKASIGLITQTNHISQSVLRLCSLPGTLFNDHCMVLVLQMHVPYLCRLAENDCSCHACDCRLFNSLVQKSAVQ